MNLAEVSIRRPVFATMLIAALMVFGLVSYPKVGVDLYPEVDFPMITVTIIYPGADPETMENNVAEPLEEAVNTLGGLNSLKTINREGVTLLLAEFDLSVDGDQALQDVRDKVSRIQNQLPAAAEAPIIDKFDIGAEPILTVALSGDLSVRQLTKIADRRVAPAIQRVPGVGGVDIVGGQEREFQVVVDPLKLSGLGLTVDDINNAIRAQNLDVPAGSVTTGGRELSLKTRGELKSRQDVANVLIPAAADPNTRLRDVAKVVDGVERGNQLRSIERKTHSVPGRS